MLKPIQLILGTEASLVLPCFVFYMGSGLRSPKDEGTSPLTLPQTLAFLPFFSFTCHTTDVFKRVRPSHIVDNTECPTLFMALDLHLRRSDRLSLSTAISLSLSCR